MSVVRRHCSAESASMRSRRRLRRSGPATLARRPTLYLRPGSAGVPATRAPAAQATPWPFRGFVGDAVAPRRRVAAGRPGCRRPAPSSSSSCSRRLTRATPVASSGAPGATPARASPTPGLTPNRRSPLVATQGRLLSAPQGSERSTCPKMPWSGSGTRRRYCENTAGTATTPSSSPRHPRPEAHVLLALSFGMKAEQFSRTHHLPKTQLTAVLDGLRDRGLVDSAGSFTDAGRGPGSGSRHSPTSWPHRHTTY